jgi:hypothetical protein
MVLNRLGRTKWHVQILTRYAHGRGVATYLARYLRGGPLKPGRIVAWDAQTVTFHYADNQDPDAQGRCTASPSRCGSGQTERARLGGSRCAGALGAGKAGHSETS